MQNAHTAAEGHRSTEEDFLHQSAHAAENEHRALSQQELSDPVAVDIDQQCITRSDEFPRRVDQERAVVEHVASTRAENDEEEQEVSDPVKSCKSSPSPSALVLSVLAGILLLGRRR